MERIFHSLCLAALLSIAAAFGFFYAWSVSAMWGLDVVSPAAAIEAMNGVNGVVQNGAFALSFFGAPVLLLVATIAGVVAGDRRAAVRLGMAFGVCLLSVHVVTFTYHIPLNQNLMAVDPAQVGADAGEIWAAYSSEWKGWNWVRTLGAGLSVLLVGLALATMGRRGSV